MTDRLAALADVGVSIWLDDLSRERLDSGNLAALIANDSVMGVTTNPTIFAQALSKGVGYQDRLAALQGSDLDTAMWSLMIDDVRDACDLFTDVYNASNGRDGRVSIEVDPTFAFDADQTITMAKDLWDRINRPNLLIKIPATIPGLTAITETIAQGISVNVTLIFGIERYQDVINAYFSGLEQAITNGHDIATIHSVASFFVSRVDTDIDSHLAKIGRPELGGQAAVANARLAYEAFEIAHNTPRWQTLAAAGANTQRPLWASTGVKNAHYPDTFYVSQLVVAGTVNTMPEATLRAFADHGPEPRDLVTGNYSEAKALFAELDALGISYSDVTARLEDEGVEKFIASWNELKETVKQEL